MIHPFPQVVAPSLRWAVPGLTMAGTWPPADGRERACLLPRRSSPVRDFPMSACSRTRVTCTGTAGADQFAQPVLVAGFLCSSRCLRKSNASAAVRQAAFWRANPPARLRSGPGGQPILAFRFPGAVPTHNGRTPPPLHPAGVSRTDPCRH